MVTHARPAKPPRLTADEFDVLYRRLLSRAAWASGDRGALDALTPARVLAAAREVRTGRTVTLAAPVETLPGPDNPEPARHRMSGQPEEDVPGGLHFARDSFAMNVHGDADSHIDALCHVIYDGTLHGGVAASSVTADGATTLSIEAARDGIVGRGVLLDIPRLRGVRWLEPGDHVTVDDLTAAETAQRVRVTEGDLLFVRVGHRRRRAELGAWHAADARAGLHPSALEFLADRRVAVLGGDGNNDTAPSSTEGVDFPVHVLAIHAMGLHLLDYLQFEDLAPLCAAEGRWSFLCVIAPLRLPDATGSPVNPIAVL
ncbi:cyclase family protein [Streptomyces nigrescens]|uniref:Cyclase n=1 Tax=Streptomyces nigrescens TaxID=1920 RepID=A0A640TYX8_STRNI|nr:cyclase family protein [Streptomyces libani]WAU01475.1 cyclase family protein [Streptomyces libani subsp. libani]GFE27421.1 cyclase [Streptomyces libani subsp. libani]GGV96188.1 cyclase [Streptomyces libani subsp. libani]